MHVVTAECASRTGEGCSLPIPGPSHQPQSPFPLLIDQAPEGSGRFIMLALLGPALMALLVPFWLIVTHLMTDPATRAVLTARPLAGLQLGLGLLVLMWIFGWPLAHLAGGAMARRRITIDGGFVHSTTSRPFGKRAWTEPLSAYAGVTHRVRTTHSGVRHELVLVHRQPSRSLILQSSPHISPETVEAAAGFFALAEIPSREAASFAPLHGFFHLAEPHPQLAAA